MKEVVVLLTPESVNRKWVTLKVGAAWGHSGRMRITMILCHVSVDTIPGMMKNKKAISLNETDFYLNQLANRVQEYGQVKIDIAGARCGWRGAGFRLPARERGDAHADKSASC